MQSFCIDWLNRLTQALALQVCVSGRDTVRIRLTDRETTLVKTKATVLGRAADKVNTIRVKARHRVITKAKVGPYLWTLVDQECPL